MNPNHTSRFITTDDQKETNIVYSLPEVWWSRHYEYIWAGQFAQSEDTVLDVACGVCHPFKMYLAQKAKKVYACDMDERMISKEGILDDIKQSIGDLAMNSFDHTLIDRIDLAVCDMTEMPYEDKQFNKVFCISVMEHVDTDTQLKAFKEFARVLQDDGLIVLTVDYPHVDLDQLMSNMEAANLAFFADHNFDIPDHAIGADYWGEPLKCVRLLLCKK